MDLYLWVKAIHVISIIAWMAGLLYLPRLFVYHVDAEVGSVQSETFKVMERRLLKAIMTPAMIASWVFGLWTAYELNAWSDGWFHAKLLLVFIMSGFHGHLAKCVKTFAADQNTRSTRYFRMINEVPTVIMIVVVIMVIVKPF
ncbi:protoporphyrinogen oxidase HemJ [Roseibium denhamense]|uniref:Protoporphyrinogen IX oxidase n=1 Tax=Roseibium denhamense TaxID=76305 RepID=A0ABY1PCP6_9HYPH|nr:protoporphyrinogen oxidase HemJ [Roseibium denhamense]MTI05268.1 protoporphyrinogen oxidase HemJ [Roseibium denhamense]SMP30575.1 putative membrane protein [Roseibium denhamense]